MEDHDNRRRSDDQIPSNVRDSGTDIMLGSNRRLGQKLETATAAVENANWSGIAG